MPACPLSTLRRRSHERPTHDSGSWLVAIHYHVGDLHSLPIAGFYRRFQPDPGGSRKLSLSSFWFFVVAATSAI
jgi:hypothetical protein